MRRFLRLSTPERNLLLKAAFLLGVITLGLRILSFQTMRRLLIGTGQKTAGRRHTDQSSANRIAWAVRTASRYIPTATCLPQALAVYVLFRQQGYPAQLHIGVAKGEGEKLQAHAWVESQGRIVVGGSRDVSRYTPLPSLEGKGA